MSVIQLGERFESLVAKLFESYGLKVTREPRSLIADGFRADILVGDKDQVLTVVETKLYRSRRVGTGTLLGVAVQISAMRRAFEAQQALLVVSCRLDAVAAGRLASVPGVIVYDYDRLLALMTGRPEIAAEFELLGREAGIFGSNEDDAAHPLPPEANEPYELKNGAKHRPPNAFVAPPRVPLRGHDLCAELDRIKSKIRRPGGATRSVHAKNFEEKCEECVRYLFDEDLVGYQTQRTSNRGLSRFDMIARIRSKSEFWRLLVTDFQTRYIVFEFKCYKKQITQGEILTTEKYLYRPALRSTAIVISLFGADKNALETARGALREHGKLILNLTIEQICRMLRAKDGIEPRKKMGFADVEEELFLALDDMLVRIDR